MPTRNSADSASTLHDISNQPQRQEGQDIVANEISENEPKATGLEQQNNNVAELPESNHSESTIGGQPTTTGDHAEQKELEKEEADKDWIVKFDGDDDPDNPRSMSKGRKWLITMVVAFSSLCVTVNSTAYTFIYGQVEPEFHVSREVATLGLSFFVVGLACGPLFLAPLSEFYGRRWIYIVSYIFVFIFIIPCAVAKNIETIIITRFFDGVAGSTFLSVAGGTIGDMFDKSELSFPMMVYSGSPFLGPATGPIIAGFINQFTNWRWTFWVLLIWTGVQLTLIALVIPETYHPVKLRQKAQRLRKSTGNQNWKAPIEIMTRSLTKTILHSCLRPFQLLFFEPMVLLLCLLSAILLGILYLFFGAFPLVFENNHGFQLYQVGLSFLGLFVGMILAICADPIWRANYRRLVRNREKLTGEPGVAEPEYRLPPTIIGIQLVWIGLFAFGFTTYSFVHWIAPIIFSGLIGMGIIWCYAGVFTFLVESYPLYAASALAANSFARSIFGAAFPLFGDQMYNGLGYQWASFLLGCLCLLVAPFPYLFFRYGKRLRKRSRYATVKE